MKILLASSEVHPYSKTGGLADMVGALGKALVKAGHEVAIVTPLYYGLRERHPELQRVDWCFDVPVGNRRVKGGLWTTQIVSESTVYLVEQNDYFDRESLYQENGTDFPDNSERFIFFSKCVAHLARYLPWKPDIVHVNDWHTALVPCLMAHQVKNERWINPPPCCLTIHNLAYQGVFPRHAFAFTNLSQDYFNSERLEFYGQLNLLKAGIVFAHAITTVSPRYAREITTEQFGHGLDGLLRKRQGQLHGILNGVDYEEWQTTHNPFLAAPYSAKDLAGKATCKQGLQREFKLPVVADIPLFGAVTRLVEQKGIDITLAALEEMLPSNIQFVLLGSGSPRYEQAFKRLVERFPGKIGAHIGYDQALSHRIEAACDFYVMPSMFEPCGLNQLYSLRYGTIPIVRTTGGLDDTVVDASESVENANGIKFSEYSGTVLATAMRKAIALYHAPEVLTLFRRNGMEADFSWASTIGQYDRVYSNMKNGI